MNYLELGYIGLFVVCFLSATILPLSSEGVLVLFLLNSYDPYICLIIATFGNSLGSISNYWLGTLGKVKTIRRFFKSDKRYDRLTQNISKYGYWLGILSWVPIVGDPLTVSLGFFRVKFLPFALVMALGKLIRYSLIIFLFN